MCAQGLEMFNNLISERTKGARAGSSVRHIWKSRLLSQTATKTCLPQKPLWILGNFEWPSHVYLRMLWAHYIAEDDLEFLILLLQLQPSGVIGMCYHSWFVLWGVLGDTIMWGRQSPYQVGCISSLTFESSTYKFLISKQIALFSLWNVNVFLSGWVLYISTIWVECITYVHVCICNKKGK